MVFGFGLTYCVRWVACFLDFLVWVVWLDSGLMVCLRGLWFGLGGGWRMPNFGGFIDCGIWALCWLVGLRLRGFVIAGLRGLGWGVVGCLVLDDGGVVFL